ncbi:MAG: hypothetical protein RIC56_06070 [Pseudomonadales bacterium]
MRMGLLVLIGLVSACTGAQGYEFVRSAGQAKAECDRAPTPAAAAECEANYRLSYDAYRAERREVLDAAEESLPDSNETSRGTEP